MNWKIDYIIDMTAARAMENCKEDLKNYQNDNSLLGQIMRKNALNDLINLKQLIKTGTMEEIANYLVLTCKTDI